MKTCPMIHTGEKQAGEVFTKFIFKAASLTDRGRQREANEDSFVFSPERGFFAVSDGMGGLAAGGEASMIIADVLPEMLRAARAAVISGGSSPEYAGKCLSECVKLMSDNISRQGSLKSDDKWFGATLTGVWLVDDSAVFVNLGDSRAYLMPMEGKIRQITHDHSILALLLEEGEITAKEAKTHPARGQITRFVGMNPPALPDTFIETIQAGDRILLCTDGLTGLVSDKKIAEFINSGGQPHEICKMLIDTANDNGGKDNITVILVEIGDERNVSGNT